MQMEPEVVKLFGVSIPKPIPPPNPNLEEQIPAEFHAALRSIGGTDGNPKLLFSRKLYKSDVKKGLTRLTIPGSQIRERFLTPQEEEYMKQKDADGIRLKRLRVTVIDPAGKVRSLRLSRWSYKKAAGGRGDAGWSYAVNGGWMEVVKENGLVEGSVIQLWWFRANVDGSLGFVISKKKTADGEMKDTASDGGRKKRRSSGDV